MGFAYASSQALTHTSYHALSCSMWLVMRQCKSVMPRTRMVNQSKKKGWSSMTRYSANSGSARSGSLFGPNPAFPARMPKGSSRKAASRNTSTKRKSK